MSRATAIVSALGSEPATTSELYDKVGYVRLMRIGLIPYHAFRDELARLTAAGVVQSRTAEDGSTLWSVPHEPSGVP